MWVRQTAAAMVAVRILLVWLALAAVIYLAHADDHGE